MIFGFSRSNPDKKCTVFATMYIFGIIEFILHFWRYNSVCCSPGAAGEHG